MQSSSSARLLEWALVATFVLHGLAMVAMAGLLLPMMPGGPTQSDAARIALLAAQPWQFRLGWLPWHLTAVSDLVLAVALLRMPGVSRLWAWIVMILTIAAIVPDQLGQLLWITQGIDLAKAAQRTGDASAYLTFEARVFTMTAIYAAVLYTLGALGWMACFISLRVWNRGLSIVSVPLFITFAVVTVGPLLPSPFSPSKQTLAAGNAIGFVLLLSWLALVIEALARVCRPQPEHGRWAPWRAPSRGIFSRLLELAANSHFVRKLCLGLPVFAFRSDIRDVVYVNYLVDAEALSAWVPPGLSLQRLGPAGRYSIFTFLTYRHGHFGPRILGPLRRLFGSPVQSNWRTYVRDDRTGHAGIYFVTNAVTTALHSLGARLLSEGMPMHLLSRGEVTRAADGTMRVRLDPGQGSAPDAEMTLTTTSDRTLPAGWRDCFADYDAMLGFIVPQDRSLCTLPFDGLTVRQEIDLGIPLASCAPLQGPVQSQAATRIVGDAAALCFYVPAVPFLWSGEKHDRWPRS